MKFANLSRKKRLDAITIFLRCKRCNRRSGIRSCAELRRCGMSRANHLSNQSLKSIASLLKASNSAYKRYLCIIAPWKSIRGLKIKRSIHLRKILDRYATYSGSDPRVAPAVLASSFAFVEEAFGAWHITGGIGKLGDALYQRCLDRGVTFEFNSPVDCDYSPIVRICDWTFALADGRINPYDTLS